MKTIRTITTLPVEVLLSLAAIVLIGGMLAIVCIGSWWDRRRK